MSDIISLLPDAIANQIAAGEVVQRPASVVKELIENAVDAGASQIKLIVLDSGKSLIQVIDNGNGMTASDARLSFERHATSKIKTSNDLFSIKSMGFRGEALASIAAIAQVELKTKNPEEELGTRIVIAASEVQKQEACVTPQGTNIAVKNIFFNVPARRKFLKSDTVEFKHILEEFQRLALAYPNIFFSLHHNQKEVFHLPVSNARQRLVAVLGKSYNEKIVPISERTEHIQIEGFIGKPEFAKKTRGEQYFFVNNRFIKSPYLNHAIKHSYDGLIGEDHYPLYAINLKIDPSRIDINVHPTKQEIKFQDERMIYNLLKVAAKHALGQYNVTPSLDFDQDNYFSHLGNPGFSGGNKMPTKIQPNFQRSDLDESNIKNWESLYQLDEGSPLVVDNSTDTLSVEGKHDYRVSLFQVHNSYILMENQKGLIVIDQHFAHQRVLFEHFLEENKDTGGSQKLLFPIHLEFNQTESIFLMDLLGDINLLGFDLQNFGQESFILHGTPAILGELSNSEDIIRQMLEDAIEDRKQSGKEKINVVLAKSIAKKSAITRNKKLSKEEMESLVAKLFRCTMPEHSPFGQKCFIHYAISDWQKEFEKRF